MLDKRPPGCGCGFDGRSPPLWQLISCLIGKRPCKRGWFLKAVPDDLGIEINLGEMEDATLLILTS